VHEKRNVLSLRFTNVENNSPYVLLFARGSTASFRESREIDFVEHRTRELRLRSRLRFSTAYRALTLHVRIAHGARMSSSSPTLLREHFNDINRWTVQTDSIHERWALIWGKNVGSRDANRRVAGDSEGNA